MIYTPYHNMVYSKIAIVSIIKQPICENQMISTYLPSLWLTMTNLSARVSSLLLLGRLLRWSSSAINEGYVVPETTERAHLQKHKTNGHVGRRRVTGSGPYPVQLRMLC